MAYEFDESVRVQDDLFQYVNGAWLKDAVIPADRPTCGGFAELSKNVEQILTDDLKAFLSFEKPMPNEHLTKTVKLFAKALDMKRRDEEGIRPLLADLNLVAALRDIDDLNDRLPRLLMQGIPLPFQLSVDADMKQTKRRAVYIQGPSLILPDTSYYQEGNPAGKALLGVYSEMADLLLQKLPLSAKERAYIIDKALSYENAMAKIVKSQEEWADYVNNYNPYPTDVVAEKLFPIDLKGMLIKLYENHDIPQIIVADPRWMDHMAEALEETGFEAYKFWAYLHILVDGASYTSEEARQIAGMLRKAMYGIKELPSIERQAYQLSTGAFSEPVGIYYGETYFGKEAKEDVIRIVKQIVETYQKRIEINDFLDEDTKKTAIKKLSTMAIKMGYPDKADPRYDLYAVNDDDSLYETLSKIAVIRRKDEFSKLFVPTDRDLWPMPGHMVNACYNPYNNDITFPAAILQKPFYGLDLKEEENLGGIGAVIGHEISHAFDNNGAQCDEYGNLNNWWTEDDFVEFQKRTQAMIEQFDGMPFAGGEVNGTLVVSENIADNGGMAVTLEIMSGKENADYQAYFQNWARVWCQKAKPEYQQMLLKVDVHSPTKLRANVQPRNFDEWYTAFDVKETDQMYIPEDKRIHIW